MMHRTSKGKRRTQPQRQRWRWLQGRVVEDQCLPLCRRTLDGVATGAAGRVHCCGPATAERLREQVHTTQAREARGSSSQNSTLCTRHQACRVLGCPCGACAGILQNPDVSCRHV